MLTQYAFRFKGALVNFSYHSDRTPDRKLLSVHISEILSLIPSHDRDSMIAVICGKWELVAWLIIVVDRDS